jgi:hypothetical protein
MWAMHPSPPLPVGPVPLHAASYGIPLESSVPNQHRETGSWRRISRPDFGLATAISDAISGSADLTASSIRLLRDSPWLLIFSDYGGAHKGARHEVYSYLVTTPLAVSAFNRRRERLRRGELGSQRRMAYKALNDNVRRRSLIGYLDAADGLAGALISFVVDKRSLHRFNESYQSETAFGTLGPWAAKSFAKLSRVAHLAAILIEGLRADGQNLLWITDEDEIAANETKHREATQLIGHLLNCYCTANMGHFRFATTASDAGDLLIEDLAAVPDLTAGSLNDILPLVGIPPESRMPDRLFIAADVVAPFKVQCMASWLSSSSGALKKANVVVDEGSDGCWVRRISVETQLSLLLDYRDLDSWHGFR